MKNAKKVGIAIVQVAIAGILVFVAVQHYAGSSATDESLTDFTVKSELENKENISENEDLHANAGGSGEISLEETEDGSFKDPTIDHQDENNENNITSEPVIKGHDDVDESQIQPKTGVSIDLDSDPDISSGLDGFADPDGWEPASDDEMAWALDLAEKNGTVLH